MESSNPVVIFLSRRHMQGFGERGSTAGSVALGGAGWTGPKNASNNSFNKENQE